MREETGGHGTCLEPQQPRSLASSLCSSPSLSSHPQRSHIPYTRNDNIESELSLLPSSTHTHTHSLTPGLFSGHIMQYLQAWKATTGPSSSTHRVGRLQARKRSCLAESRTSSRCPTVAFLASSAEELACMSCHVGRRWWAAAHRPSGGERHKSRAKARPCDIGCATE